MHLSKSTLVVLLSLVACHKHGEGDHDHTHGPGAEAGEETEPAPLSITRWTSRAELFVELPPPVVGKPIPYHAHVTLLEGFKAASEGRFTVRFEDAGKLVKEHAQTGVKRPGIFVFEGDAPPVGKYHVTMTYELAGVTDVWDCGEIAVLAQAPAPAAEEASANLTFLKESQWKIAFATAWSEERPMRKHLELPGIVEFAGSDQLTLNAPTRGRFLHDPKRSLAVGMRVEKGDVIGSVVPNVDDEDYSRLLFAVEEAALAKTQNEKEITRIEPLVKDGLLPEKRLIELRNENEVVASRLKLAQQRVGALTGDGKQGLPVKAGLSGVVTEVAAGNGQSVDGGAPLVRLGGSTRLWVRTRSFGRGPFEAAAPTAIRASGGAPFDLTSSSARFLSVQPTIDPSTRLGTWFVDLGDAFDPVAAGVAPGATVIVSAHHGAATTAVAVPVGAVVEIDTRPYVFVQVDGEHFEKRLVSVGAPDGGFVPIVRGVDKAERVVTVGGFDIHLAAVMGTVESHRH